MRVLGQVVLGRSASVIIQDAQTHERIYQMKRLESAVAILLVFLLLGSAVPGLPKIYRSPSVGN